MLSMGWCDVKFVRRGRAVGMLVGSFCWCAGCEVRDLALGACSVEPCAVFLGFCVCARGIDLRPVAGTYTHGLATACRGLRSTSHASYSR